jgi:hypothetical protein
VTGLLYLKQQRLVPRATVVPIGAVQRPAAVAAVPDTPVYEETPTVRVIAG